MMCGLQRDLTTTKKYIQHFVDMDAREVCEFFQLVLNHDFDESVSVQAAH